MNVYANEVDKFKRDLLERAIREAGGNRTKAAERLGIAPAYLFRLIRMLGVSVPRKC